MSQEEYFEQVAFLEAQNPNEPLLKLLQSSYCEANVKIYLPFALNRIDEARTESVEPVKAHKLDEKQEADLLRQYGRQYGATCKESNKLHQHAMGNAPKDLIDSILSKQADLDVIASKLNGTYQEAEITTEVELEGVAKYKKINSLRASISRCKSDLDKLIGSEEKAKIEKKEQQLIDYQFKLKKLESNTLYQ
jgi:hypothetical protein